MLLNREQLDEPQALPWLHATIRLLDNRPIPTLRPGSLGRVTRTGRLRDGRLGFEVEWVAYGIRTVFTTRALGTVLKEVG